MDYLEEEGEDMVVVKIQGKEKEVQKQMEELSAMNVTGAIRVFLKDQTWRSKMDH